MGKNNIKKDHKQEVGILKEKIKKQAEELILNAFPKKIIELDAMIHKENLEKNLHLTKTDINIPIPDVPYKESKYNYKKLNVYDDCKNLLKSSHKKQTTSPDKNEIDREEDVILANKPWLFPNGIVKSNQYLVELINVTKPFILEMIDELNIIKLGIILMIPKTEDGNNFGVEIQEEAISAIEEVESDVHGTYDTFSVYYLTRGKLITKIAKYPHSEDYRKAIQEKDEQFYLFLCSQLSEIKKHYAILHDVVIKNLNKINKPKASNELIDLMY